MTQTPLELLRRVRLLTDLSDEVLGLLATRAREIEVPEGKTIFSQGEKGDALYIVRDGRVRIDVEVDIHDAEPATLSLVSIRPPEDFGSLALIDHEPRSASAVAETDVRLLALYRDDVEELLTQPEPARAMLRALTAVVRRMNARLGDAAFGSVPALTARAIRGYADRFGKDLPEGRFVEHAMTLDDLAREAGLLPSDVRWVMVTWELDGVVERRENGWLLRRPQVLADCAKQYRPNPMPGAEDDPAPSGAPPSIIRPSRDEIAAELSRSPLLRGLSESAIQALAGRAQIRSYGAGATIFDEGEPGNALYVVHSGEVRIHMSSPTRQPINLLTVRPPRAFGELALLDGGKRSASAKAETATTLITLYRDDFHAVLDATPAACGALLQSLAGIIRDMNQRFSDVALLDRRGRVCKAILGYLERYGKMTDEGWLIDHPMTSDDLAADAGLYTIEVQRILRGELEPDHLLEHRIDSWLVRDRSFLERCARRYR
jgi:CRP/FNR family transcriptional regulator